MTRKFSELTLSEQIQFQGLVEFTKETLNEYLQVKLNIVKKFRLDPKDPVVYDFLTDMHIPVSSQPIPVSKKSEQTIEQIGQPKQLLTASEPSLPTTTATKPLEKIRKREMTYANSEDLIVIQNRLLHAISHLTLNERRLILFLSPIVRKQIEKTPNDRVFYVYVQDFVNEYRIKSKKYYGELEKIADSILDKNFFFWYKTENGRAKKGVNWVSECDYIENEAKIKVKLDDTVIEMLTVFDKTTGNFWTQYQKEWIINLGAYGIVMLEMILSSKQNNGYYTVEHLREKFNCVDTYPRFSDFKLYVIDKSIKEIQKYTPIQISYEIAKSGKKVKGLTFTYTDDTPKSLKDNPKNNDKPQETNPFVNFKMSQKQLSLFASKIKQATGQDIDEIISELCNVHLQSKHINFLKVLDYVPSDWYTNDEIVEHLTAEQIAQAQAQAEQERLNQKRTKKQAKDQQKQQEQQEMEQRQQHLAELFESLPFNEQEKVLDEIEQFFKGNLMFNWFKEARKQGIVHKDVRFMAKFYEYFGV